MAISKIKAGKEMFNIVILFAFLAVVAFPLTAFAADFSLGDTIRAIAEAFKMGLGREAAAGVITLLMFLWRRFGSELLIGKLSTRTLPFVTATMGLLSALPAALTAASFSWSNFLFDALLVSAEASLFWSAVGKFLLPKVFGEMEKAA